MYALRDRDPKFREAWEDALEHGSDRLEDIAHRRARNGSDTLLIFLLKARRPDKYRERSAVEHSGEQCITITRKVVHVGSDPSGN